MLKDLKILNGTLDLEFNEYIYEYTISVNEDIDKLEIDYILEEDCYLNITNNNLVEGENIVYLDVYNIDNKELYTLYVYKDSISTVSSIDNYMSSLEVTSNNDIDLYKVELLCISIFLLIIILFCLLFKKRDKKNIVNYNN